MGHIFGCFFQLSVANFALFCCIILFPFSRYRKTAATFRQPPFFHLKQYISKYHAQSHYHHAISQLIEARTTSQTPSRPAARNRQAPRPDRRRQGDQTALHLSRLPLRAPVSRASRASPSLDASLFSLSEGDTSENRKAATEKRPFLLFSAREKNAPPYIYSGAFHIEKGHGRADGLARAPAAAACAPGGSERSRWW